MRTATTFPVLLLAAFIFGGCETASTGHEPVHPRAEQAQQVVDAFVTAYAEYRGIEKQPVGLAVDSWLSIPDAGLAGAVAALPLPHSANRAGLSPAPWTLAFMEPVASFPGPGKLLAYIVDREEPYYGLLFTVSLVNGTVKEAHHSGNVSREVGAT